jgi:hypothetical protein
MELHKYTVKISLAASTLSEESASLALLLGPMQNPYGYK